jgi:hypothetical protein
MNSYYNISRRGEYIQIWRTLAPLVSQLETLDLIVLQGLANGGRKWLRLVSPYKPLTDFTNLESLSIVQEAMFYPSNGNIGAAITAMPPKLLRLHIQRLTIACLAVINADIQSGCVYVSNLNELVLHYEPGSELPGPSTLYACSTRATLQKIGLWAPIYWSVVHHEPEWFAGEKKGKFWELDDGILGID